MATYVSGNESAEVDETNEAAFETAGWSRVDTAKPSKKDDK